jgi:hypothetical protein
MKLTRIIIAGAATIAVCLALTACNSSTVVTEYDANGKTVKTTESKSESPMTDDSISTGGAITALKLETSGGTTTGTILPNILIGGGVTGISKSPKSDSKPIIGASWSAGILNSLFSSSATSGEFRYIGTPSETAEQTATRLKAALDFRKGIVPSASTDSSPTNGVTK